MTSRLEHLATLIATTWRSNAFWRNKWSAHGLSPFEIRSLADLERFPLTTKAELVADQANHPPYGTNLTAPRESYTRLHQTSGTKGQPLRWLDTNESWRWMLDCWRHYFEWAGVGKNDRIVFPFSFGPFLGFWTAFEAATEMGAMVIAAGGVSSGARVKLIVENNATAVCCTPTYALHLAEVGGETLRRSNVKTLIVAGEPGGSIPATRERIESAWNATLIDHTGLTEVGPLASEYRDERGMMAVLESHYIAEVRDPATLAPTPDGELGELIVTNLGRVGSPLIRYRTGDLVRPLRPANGFLRLKGGVLGRVDDMIPLRGNNFYPSSLEAVIRRFPEVVEYQVEVDTTSPLAELRIDVEPTPNAGEGLAARVAGAIRDELLFRADVAIVGAGTLPRYEMKASRVKRK